MSAALAAGVVAINRRLLGRADRRHRTLIAALETVGFVVVAFVMYCLGAELSWLVGADLVVAAAGFFGIFSLFPPGADVTATRVRRTIHTTVIVVAAVFISLVLPWMVAAAGSPWGR